MDIIIYTLQAVSSAIINPLNLLMLIIIGIVSYRKNRKISIIQKMTIGESLNSPLELTLSQIVLGILAGTVASIILALLKVNFNDSSGVELILMLSIFSIFYKERITKIPYIASVLGILNIVLLQFKQFIGITIDIKIDFLIIFIGVIYLVEGLLVAIDGDRGAIPVFMNRSSKIIGGFSFNRNWIIPISILIVITGSSVGLDTISMAAMTLVGIPFYGVIGYNAVTFTKSKKKKILESGILRIAYGGSLILISYIASLGIIGQIVTIIYTILMYELLIRYEKESELKGSSLYVSDDEGVTVLEVAPNSSAFEVGVRRGDKIMSINGEDVKSEIDILKVARTGIFKVSIKIKKQSGNTVEYLIKPKNKNLGILLVPKFINKEKDISKS